MTSSKKSSTPTGFDPPYTVARPSLWVSDQDGNTFPALPLARLRIPFYSCVGRHEKLSTKQLEELIVDLQVELSRRLSNEKSTD